MNNLFKINLFLILLTFIHSAVYPLYTNLLPPIDSILFDTVNQREAYLEELTATEGIDSASLAYNYLLFRVNQNKIIDSDYTIINHMYFYCLSNEFDLNEYDREDNLTNAIYYYEQLTNYLPKQIDYLTYRKGVCYYKMGELEKANKYISKALMNGLENSEAYYYKSLLSAYYNADFDLALFYLNRVNQYEVFVNIQDLLHYRASLENELGNTNQAKIDYENALAVNKNRFYIHYDLLPFYLKIGDTNNASTYSWNSFSYLYSLDDADYRVKAYQQYLDMKEYEKQATYRKEFDFDESYEEDPNVYFFSGSTMFIRRTLGTDLTLPVSESGALNADEIYYTLYENYVDYGTDSGIFLVMGQGIVDTDMEEVLNLGVPITKLAFYSPVAILLDPDNTTKSWVDTQILECDYYMGTDIFDVNNDSNWDFIIWGYDEDNTIIMTVYFPLDYTTDVYTFTPTKHNAEIVIQDTNNDGEFEILLLDDDIYQLN